LPLARSLFALACVRGPPDRPADNQGLPGRICPRITSRKGQAAESRAYGPSIFEPLLWLYRREPVIFPFRFPSLCVVCATDWRFQSSIASASQRAASSGEKLVSGPLAT